ncbi:hypothetical protein [Parazoarcus communis]|uniref:Uncharacterized protein n=1 Tax=Parazoarcus communis SWub3 = DSM 12120 TaxID=1121029 RepID=A0A323UP72_9RHOO|nr:hypothetical protein [Parazoarcus communis]NMG71662.1 hypothetical protein [Parazoarcus communis SWub3 = DSM 12120]PZA14762.1 hypothetical protein DNK49_19965 [Azoarcus communis] [Parazoarcus communis SWub3 = DSM 12120]
MKTWSDTQAYTAAIGSGTLLWVITGVLTGAQEAWDAQVYWVISYPLAILIAGAVGHFAPQRAWRWGLAIVQAQALLMLVSISDLSLAPLGLALFAVISIPTVMMSLLTARKRLRNDGSA